MLKDLWKQRMDEFLGGFLSGCVEVSLMQPTVYYKNASQQQLPFTLQPNILYRGVGASVINMAILTGLHLGMLLVDVHLYM